MHTTCFTAEISLPTTDFNLSALSGPAALIVLTGARPVFIQIDRA